MSPQRVATISIFSIVGPIGTLFNAVIIIVITTRKNLHTPTYILYLHMALCDMIVSLIGSAMGITIYVTGKFVFCQGVISTVLMGGILSSVTVVLISIDRYTCLTVPLLYQQKVTKKRLLLCLVILWIIILCDLVPILTEDALINPVNDRYAWLNRKNCILTKLLHPEYILLNCIGLALVPTTVTVIINVLILRLATKQYNKHKNKVASITQNQSLPTRYMKRDNWNTKAIRTTLSIVVTHLVCTLPFLLVIIIDVTCNFCFPYKQIKYGYFLHLLSYFTSTINPLIYTSTNVVLRQEVKKLITRCCKPDNHRLPRRVTDISSFSLTESRSRVNSEESNLYSTKERKINLIGYSDISQHCNTTKVQVHKNVLIRSPNMTERHRTCPNVTEHDRTSTNKTEPHRTWPIVTECQRTWPNITEHDGFSSTSLSWWITW